jgi:metal-responsive CopG/Arc/MetJ family transcriptional regulator
MAFSFRLDEPLERRITALAKAQGVSRSELVRQCLADYLGQRESQHTAWELGKHLFGCYNSGQTNRSQRAKEIAREKMRGRHSQQNPH